MQLHLNARERAPPVLSEPRPLQEDRYRPYFVRCEAAKKKPIFLLYIFFAAMRQLQPKKCVRPKVSNHVTGCHLQSEPFLRQRDVNRGHPTAVETDARRKIYL